MKDVFTSTTTYLDKPKDFQDNNKSHKHLNIIPFIDEKESVSEWILLMMLIRFSKT